MFIEYHFDLVAVMLNFGTSKRNHYRKIALAEFERRAQIHAFVVKFRLKGNLILKTSLIDLM